MSTAQTSGRRGGGRAWLLGATGVGLHVAAFPPLSWWPLALLAAWPLAVLALEARSGAAAFRRLYVAGLAIFLLGSAWLVDTSAVNLALVAALEATWIGVFGWAAHRGLAGRPALPALPVIWTAHELLRFNLPLSGYPWQMLGQALAANPIAVQAADLGGVLLLSFVATSVAAAGLGWQRGERAGRWALALILPALALVYGLVRPHTLAEPAPGPVLATIQPSFPQRLKEDSEAADVRYGRCLELSAQALRGGEPVDLLVWPETMWPFAMGEGEPEETFSEGFGVREVQEAESAFLAPLLSSGPLGARAARLLIGTPYFRKGPDGRTLTSNSAVYFDRDGRRLGRYDKHILVPGGESIPYARWLPAGLRAWTEGFIRDIAGFVIDLEPGSGPQRIALDDVQLGVTICFENGYGEYTRRIVRDGADVLVNLSNEAWFGDSEFDHMELHSVLRAVETRRAVFRSTNSGISCLVRPDGRAPEGADRLVVDGRDRSVAGAFRARVPIHSDRTLYVLWGDHWAWACVAGALFLAWRPVRASASLTVAPRSP